MLGLCAPKTRERSLLHHAREHVCKATTIRGHFKFLATKSLPPRLVVPRLPAARRHAPAFMAPLQKQCARRLPSNFLATLASLENNEKEKRYGNQV
jgi:hypothetical protein